MAADTFWLLLTRLGESQILLPAMAAALAWIWFAAGDRAATLRWIAATATAALLTTATKVAFLGYEIGYAPWNFTGISGHAMFAASIWPVLAVLATQPASAQQRAWAIGAGYAFAAVLAYSRIRVGAHSASEAMTGFVLGGLASAWVLQRGLTLPRRPPLWLGFALVLWFAGLAPTAPPAPTHDWVIRLSLAVSERPQPYKRWEMHRDWRRAHRQPAAQALPSSAARLR